MSPGHSASVSPGPGLSRPRAARRAGASRDPEMGPGEHGPRARATFRVIGAAGGSARGQPALATGSGAGPSHIESP